MAEMKSLVKADQEKQKLSRQSQKRVLGMYENLYGKAKYNLDSIVESPISEEGKKLQVQQYSKRLDKEIEDITKIVGKEAMSSGKTSAGLPVEANNSFMASSGLGLAGAYSFLSTEVVSSVAKGTVYKGSWTLSKALWKTGKTTKSGISKTIADGLAKNKSAYDIAKALEHYLNPKAKKPWPWGKVYPGSGKSVDYNAQRLVRTMIQHAFQQSLTQIATDNPFVTGIQWHSEFSHRSCELCVNRDGTIYSPPDTMPFDHPNGICFFTTVIPKSMSQIADEIAAWLAGGSNPSLDLYMIDAFAA